MIVPFVIATSSDLRVINAKRVEIQSVVMSFGTVEFRKRFGVQERRADIEFDQELVSFTETTTREFGWIAHGKLPWLNV